MPDSLIQLRGLDGVLQTLQALPAEVVSKRGGPVRAALRKGAVVILREEALNLARATDALSALEGQSSGLLQSSLIVSRGKAPTSGKGERMLVRVKRKTYPGRRGRPVTTLQTANLLEYGSEKQPAEPWIRPAFAAKAETAIRTVEAELIRQVDRVVEKLARQNKGR